jgi:hypothetical protein
MERSLYKRDGDTYRDGDSSCDPNTWWKFDKYPNTNSRYHADRYANHLSDLYSIASSHQYAYLDTNSDLNGYREPNSNDLADGNRDSD